MNQRFVDRLAVCLLAVALLPLPARATCSRVILLPSAQSGQTVAFRGGEAYGVMPDVFKIISAKTGCSFRWSLVPRIRLEAMFEAGSADMLLAATQTAQRDRFGLFVPLVESRATLISLTGKREPIRNFEELLSRKSLRVALVRGYDYGEQYRALVKALHAQGRVFMEPDPITIGRLMAHGMADVTIMPPTALAGALRDDPRVESLLPQLRIEPLDELPWIKTGIYLSQKSLSGADRDLLESALLAERQTGVWWAALNRYYSAADMAGHVRPIKPHE